MRGNVSQVCTQTFFHSDSNHSKWRFHVSCLHVKQSIPIRCCATSFIQNGCFRALWHAQINQNTWLIRDGDLSSDYHSRCHCFDTFIQAAQCFSVVLFSLIVAGLQSFPAVSYLFDASVHPSFVEFFVDFLKQFPICYNLIWGIFYSSETE